MQIREEERAPYDASAETVEDAMIQRSLLILRNRLRQPGAALERPQAVRDYLTLHLAGETSERFAVLLLDSNHRVIAFTTPFQGTIDGARVYPREVVKAALQHNAAAVIFAHNHPSGNAEASRADITLTRQLRDSLALIDVRVLDHFIVGGCQDLQFTSMAEKGLI